MKCCCRLFLIQEFFCAENVFNSSLVRTIARLEQYYTILLYQKKKKVVLRQNKTLSKLYMKTWYKESLPDHVVLTN